MPSLLNIAKLASLIRNYFALGGHHVQFNIVDTATLCAAQEIPKNCRSLLIRMTGYSDYFNDMNTDLQVNYRLDRTVFFDRMSLYFDIKRYSINDKPGV